MQNNSPFTFQHWLNDLILIVIVSNLNIMSMYLRILSMGDGWMRLSGRGFRL